jgi:ribonuclease D
MRPDRQGHSLRRADLGQGWRDRSHQESHSAAGAKPIGPIAYHPLASQAPAAVVQTNRDLAKMVGELKAAGSFAFDSEFIGERSYEPHLCLVQTATVRDVFIVDPFVPLNLSGLWELLVCPTVEKIVLAGQQDFAPAVRCTQRPPANIMDLQIAAGFVHVEHPLSLDRLLTEFMGVTLDKGGKFTHWDNRPLSAMQMRYAGDDVRYLPAAREAIGKRLAELGRADWARQECAAALEDITLYLPPPQALYLRVRQRDRLRRRQLAVLRELAIWRDQAARQEDLPTRTMLKDGILVAMARHPAGSLADLGQFKGLPRPVESKYGRQIVEATARGMAAPEDQLPPPEPEEPWSLRPRADKLWAEITQFCLERAIAPSLVASRKEVGRACRAIATGQPVEHHRLLRDWRKELLGDLLTGGPPAREIR